MGIEPTIFCLGSKRNTGPWVNSEKKQRSTLDVERFYRGKMWWKSWMPTSAPV